MRRPRRAARLLAVAWLSAACLPAQEDAAPPAPAAAPVIVGEIDGTIDLATSAYVRRALAEAEAAGAERLLLHLNTFGGRVDAAVAIRDALLSAELETAVFVDRRAISAGALISLACERIVMSPGGTIGAAAPIQAGPGGSTPQPVEEKYLSYFREEMRATAEARGRDPDVAEAMADADKEIEGVSPAGKLLTLSTSRALELGVADARADDLEGALAGLGWDGPTREVEWSWSERLVAFLASAPVAALLTLGFFALGYLELQTPGIGIFGAGSILCLLLLTFGHVMVNLAGWEELILAVVALALIAVEAFVLPGFGVAGILGAVAGVAALVMLAMAGDWSDLSYANPFTGEALVRVLLSLLLAVGAVALLGRWLVRSRSSAFGGRLVLAQSLAPGGSAPASGGGADDAARPGAAGRALTPLRPAGRAEIGGRRLRVETEGEFVAPGEAVRVVRLAAGRIVVRKVRDA